MVLTRTRNVYDRCLIVSRRDSLMGAQVFDDEALSRYCLGFCTRCMSGGDNMFVSALGVQTRRTRSQCDRYAMTRRRVGRSRKWMMAFDHGNYCLCALATDRKVSSRISASEVLFSSRSHSAAEDRTRHLLVDIVEWVHRAFYPCFVDL